MEHYYPSYYDTFQCSASRCRDNCCIGWEIDIDDDALANYKKIEPESSFSILSHIDISGEDAHIKLGTDNRCPFLNCNNLCKLILAHGEKALCDICRLHPRFINEYETWSEYGLDLCCEEAARLILSKDVFYPEIISKDSYTNSLLVSRTNILNEIFNYDNSTTDFMGHLLAYAETIDELIFDKNYDKIKTTKITSCSFSKCNLHQMKPETIKKCLTFLLELTPLSPSWHIFEKETLCNLEYILKQKDKFEKKYPEADLWTKRLLRHYIYHYYMESIWEDSTCANVFLAVFMTTMTQFFNAALYAKYDDFSFDHQRFISIQLSKEIEYSAENLEKVLSFSTDFF